MGIIKPFNSSCDFCKEPAKFVEEAAFLGAVKYCEKHAAEREASKENSGGPKMGGNRA